MLLREINAKVARLVDVVLRVDEVQEGRMYTRREAAIILRCTTRTVDRLVRAKVLPAIRLGRNVRITGRSLLRCRDRQISDTAKVLRI